jgi:acetyl esterase/lipase
VPEEKNAVGWDVDRRAATLRARLYVWGMRLARDKRAFEGPAHTRRVALERQASGDAPPTRWTRLTRRVSTRRADGMTVWRLRRPGGRGRARVLYLHGGGYVHPLTQDYWRLLRALSMDGEVVVPAYPLAPGADVDTVLPRLVELAQSLLDEGRPLVLMGDSAGGALALEIAMSLRDRGCARQPRAVIGLCPWLDATLDEPSVRDLEPTDPMLAESGLRAAGRWWAGSHDPRDPSVSPVRGDLAGLPPLHVHIGDRDILRPAVDDLASRAAVQDADLHVHEVPAMFHVWMTRPIPEGRRTRRQLRRLVRECGST